MLEAWADIKEAKGDIAGADIARTLARHHGDEPFPIHGESKAEARERARFGDDYIGVQEVQQALDSSLTPDQVPPIDETFTQAELARAKELDQVLYLSIDHVGDTPLTMAYLQSAIAPKLAQEGGGRLLYNTDWCQTEPFYTSQTPRVGWRLASKGVLVDPRDPQNRSTSKDYLAQTEFLANYMKEVVFAGQEMSQPIQQAIAQFHRQKGSIARLMNERDWKKAADKLAGLSLNQLVRERPVEELLLHTLMLRTRGQARLENIYAWSAQQSAAGDLVYSGFGDRGGVRVRSLWPGVSDGHLGVSLSR